MATKTSKRKQASVIRGTYCCTGIEKGSRQNEVVKRFFPLATLSRDTRRRHVLCHIRFLSNRSGVQSSELKDARLENGTRVLHTPRTIPRTTSSVCIPISPLYFEYYG